MQNFAVIGNPISHSISPFLHNFAINYLKLNAFYGRKLVESPLKLKSEIVNLKLQGANITLPFKEEAYKMVDILDDDAKKIGSVNTIIKNDNKFIGFNTDFSGFYLSVSKFGVFKRALILGAGGTTRSISYALLKNGIKFDILNRSSRNFDFGADKFFLWNSEIEPKYDVVINSTSAGLSDFDLPAPFEILEPIISNSKLAFDAIYGKNTPFLNLARTNNVQTCDGLDMLINQAALAFEIFFDGKFSFLDVKNIMQYGLKLKFSSFH